MYRPYKPYPYNNYQNGSHRNSNRNNHRNFYSDEPHSYRHAARMRNNNHPYYNGGPTKQCAPQNSRSWAPKHKTVDKPKQPKTSKNETKTEDPKPPSSWNRADALKAIELEEEHNRSRSNQYILRFPDPFLDKTIVKGYSTAIVDVRVQQPITPRFVYIHLKPDVDHKKIISEISRIPFGTGFLKLEPSIPPSNQHLTPEDVDPYTIFLGNIHPSTSIKVIKEGVHKAHRVDVGFAKKHKFGRYAFAKFRNAEDAREAFSLLKENNTMNDTDLIVRFRRLKGSIVSSGTNKPKEMPKELKSLVNGAKKDETEVIDITNDESEEPEPIQAIEIKKEPEETAVEKVPSTLEDLTEKLFTNNVFDWDKLRLQEISRYEMKPDINKLPLFNTSHTSLSLDSSPTNYDINTELDELFNQLDSDFSYVFNDDFEF